MCAGDSGARSAAAATEPVFSSLNLRVRFDPPETETHALREVANVIAILRNAGYDPEPMGLSERTP